MKRRVRGVAGGGLEGRRGMVERGSVIRGVEEVVEFVSDAEPKEHVEEPESLPAVEWSKRAREAADLGRVSGISGGRKLVGVVISVVRVLQSFVIAVLTGRWTATC